MHYLNGICTYLAQATLLSPQIIFIYPLFYFIASSLPHITFFIVAFTGLKHVQHLHILGFYGITYVITFI